MTPEQQKALQDVASTVIADLLVGFTQGKKKLVIETDYFDADGTTLVPSHAAHTATSTWKIIDA